MASTKEILDRRLKALDARDLDGILADCAADIVALTPAGFFSPDAETPDNIYEPASDTYVVRDGKIVAQSFAAKITPKR
jgi:hypothetical protein